MEKYLNLDALYVLGTNCVDNGPRQGLEKFLNVASADPDTVLHYAGGPLHRWHDSESVRVCRGSQCLAWPLLAFCDS